MSKFTKEQIEFIESTLASLSVSGSLDDMIRLAHIAEGIREKLAQMKSELDAPPPPDRPNEPPFEGILKE